MAFDCKVLESRANILPLTCCSSENFQVGVETTLGKVSVDPGCVTVHARETVHISFFLLFLVNSRSHLESSEVVSYTHR